MVTNLPAEAKAKWVKYSDAKTPEEKLKALQEFLSAIPKHKGTENLVQWVRRRMAELREEIEERKAKKVGGGGPSFFIEKEGVAQILILGMPSSGKSSILSMLTNAKPQISDTPFTTKFPVPGMLAYEDIQFQLVEAPAVVKGISEGAIWWGSRVLGLARNADALMIVIDLSNEPLHQLETIVHELSEVGIYVMKPRGYAVIEKSKAYQNVRVINLGKLVNCTLDDVRKLLESYRIYNALVKIYGEVTLEDVERSIFENVTYKPTIILANKSDLLDPKTLSELVESIKVRYPSIPVIATSAKTGYGLSDVPRHLFKILNIIRIYAKEPNNELPSPKPLVLKEGATVMDAVKNLRSELLQYFKYARIWGPSAKYPGERVGLEHRLMDGDVIEVHTRIKAI
ncbi:MAG: GTPase [Sulfolobales archaeon]